MTPTEQDKELREKILNDWLIHEAECSSSLYREPCDCIQRNVATNIMKLISADRKRVALEARLNQSINDLEAMQDGDSDYEWVLQNQREEVERLTAQLNTLEKGEE